MNKKKGKKAPSKKEPEPEKYHPEKRPFPKRPSFVPIKKQQIDRPRIRRPQHYG